MNENKKNWVDWHEFLPKEKADNYDFGSIPIVEKFAFLLAKQALIIDKKIPISIEHEKLAITRPLLMGMASNALAAIKLAKENFGNEVYPILRSLIERIITFYYLQACDLVEYENYIDYSKQKTYRLLSRKLTINDKTFTLRNSESLNLDEFSDLKRAVEKYTSSVSRRPITRWSNTSIEKKLSIIDSSGITDISLLMITLAAIYDDGSEALHGTIYGCTFHFGAL